MSAGFARIHRQQGLTGITFRAIPLVHEKVSVAQRLLLELIPFRTEAWYDCGA